MAGKKIVGRPFEKGQSGNPSGRPKLEGELRDLARDKTKEGFEKIWKLACSAKNETVKLGALKEIFDRGWGKALLPIVTKGLDGMSEKEITDFLGYNPTEDELSRVAGALESIEPAGEA